MTASIIAQEDATLTQDVDVGGATVDAPFILATALLQAASPLERTKVIEVQIEYESESSQTIDLEYSINGGQTWSPYSTINVVVTTGPTIIAARRTLHHHNLQLRLITETLGKFRLLVFVARIVTEARVNP